MTSFKSTARGSTFAREGFSKKADAADNRDFMAEPASSFGAPVIAPKRMRPRTAKATISVRPQKPIRSDRVRSRSIKRKKEEKEINADLSLDIDELEKKRNETK